jgi:hypothetical protein
MSGSATPPPSPPPSATQAPILATATAQNTLVNSSPLLQITNPLPFLQKDIFAYMSSEGPQSDVMSCNSNYENLITNGQFDTEIVAPIYSKLKSKLCDPQIMTSYIQNLIDLPDKAPEIDQINAKLDTINAKLDMISNYEETNIPNVLKVDTNTFTIVIVTLSLFGLLLIILFFYFCCASTFFRNKKV